MKPTTREDTSLLEGLLEQRPQPTADSTPATNLQPEPPTVSAPETRPLSRARSTVRRARPAPAFVGDLYSRLGRSIALLGFLALSGLLWYAGAAFTLLFLASWYNVAALGLGQWVIPLAITATEIFLWPRWRGSWPQWIGFSAVLLFDVGTTCFGLMPLIAGREVNLFGGFTLPQAGAWLYGFGIIGGLLLAYGPEKLGKWALSELYALWR